MFAEIEKLKGVLPGKDPAKLTINDLIRKLVHPALSFCGHWGLWKSIIGPPGHNQKHLLVVSGR